MDFMCDSKFVKKAQNLIKKFNLVIDDEEYEIVTTSIHINSMVYDDPFVQTKGRKGKTWFPYKKDYLKYIDFDLSDDLVTGGIRINTIRSIKNKSIAPTAGDVFKLVSSKLSEKELLKLKGKKPTERDSPRFYLKAKTKFDNKKIWTLPRYADFKKMNRPNDIRLRYQVVTHMFTNSFDWFPDKIAYPQMAIIALYLFVINEHKYLLDNGIISEKTLEKYIRYAFKASHKTASYIYQDRGPSGIGVKQACELFGHFAFKFHNFSRL